MSKLLIIIVVIASFFLGSYARSTMNKTDADVAEIVISEDSYTLHYEWDTAMSATVNENPCNACVRICEEQNESKE